MNIVTFLENHMLSCSFKKFFGVECLGCGIQRAIIYLLKGEILQSFYTYPALIPLIFMFIFLFLHIIFDFKKGAVVLKFMFICNSVLILIQYILKHLL